MFGLTGNFSIYRCNTCGLFRLDPKLSSAKLAKYYPSEKYYSYLDNTNPGPFWRLRSFLIAKKSLFSRILNIFIHVPAMPMSTCIGKIMDVGCGNGETLLLLKNLGWDTYGLDIDHHAIELAHKRGLANVRFGSYTRLGKYPDNYFDVIRLYHVIEHLDNPIRFLKLAHRKLKKGGELIIGTPNAASLIARIARTYWLNLDSPRHLFVFSPKNLKQILITNKFTVQSTDFCSIGGFAGSIQYYLTEKFGIQKNIIFNSWFILLLYPLERIIDWLKLGDVFIVHATK